MLAAHTQEPRVINVDKNAAYPKAVDEMKASEELSESVELRQNKYLNNCIEQDHRFIKRLTLFHHSGYKKIILSQFYLESNKI
jgi:transposase-like protein